MQFNCLLFFSSFIIQLLGNPLHGESFAQKEYYLIDSLDISLLSQYDKDLLDSSLHIYHTSKVDTTRLLAINSICEHMMDVNWSRYNTFLHGLVTKKLADSSRYSNRELYVYKDILASTTGNQGYLFDESGQVYKAIEKYRESLAIYQKLNYKIGMASAINNIGAGYINLGNIKKGLEYHFEALKIGEETKDSSIISASLSNIAYVYDNQGEVEKAIEYYQKGYEVAKGIGDYNGMAYALNNLGYVFAAMGKKEEAIIQFDKSLEIRQNIGDLEGIGTSLHSIATIHLDNSDFDLALPYFQEALVIRQQINDVNGIIHSYTAMANIYLKLSQPKKAEEQALKALEMAKEIGYPENIMSAATQLSLAYEQLGKWEDAFYMHRLATVMKDSVHNAENERITIRKQTQYEYEHQKTLDDLEHQKQIALEHQTSEHQKDLKYLAYLIAVVVAIFLFYVINRLRLVRRQKQLIEKSKVLIEDKNYQIESSINYAQRIQQAVLPEIELQHLFPQSFLLYAPKDIVSGDFYWWEETDEKILFAVADCTGHGVPGGFMSMLGSIFLNEIFNSKKIYNPALILDELSRLVSITLRNRFGETIQDGMDISFAVLHKKTLLLEWAGANNPLYIIRANQPNECEIIKANRQPIGSTGRIQPFTCHRISLQKNDLLYLFSDGYADQFGGADEKKMGYKAFRSYLVEISGKPMMEQEQLLRQYFMNWCGENEQIDDVCVMGVRV